MNVINRVVFTSDDEPDLIFITGLYVEFYFVINNTYNYKQSKSVFERNFFWKYRCF